MYAIVRFYRDSEHPDHKRVIKKGLTLYEAQEHCQREDTHELDEQGIAIRFDGYTNEKNV